MCCMSRYLTKFMHGSSFERPDFRNVSQNIVAIGLVRASKSATTGRRNFTFCSEMTMTTWESKPSVQSRIRAHAAKISEVERLPLKAESLWLTCSANGPTTTWSSVASRMVKWLVLRWGCGYPHSRAMLQHSSEVPILYCWRDRSAGQGTDRSSPRSLGY